MKRRNTILTAALAVLGTAGPLAPSIHAAFQDTPATRPATAPANLSDPATLATLLHDPASSPDQRELAAARLLVDASTTAINELIRALRPTSPAPVQLAAATAIATSARPEPRLAEALMTLLTADGPVNVKREAGKALATLRDDPQIITSLAEVAVSQGATPTRQGAVAGLARLPGKPAANALMLLLDGDAPQALERDAAEALRAMTGIDIPADDLAGWQDWWESASQLDDTQFKARLLETRAADSAAVNRRAESAVAALLAVSRQQFRAMAASEQAAMLEQYLQSASPELREVGAEIAREEADFGEDIPPSVMHLVKAAITDPSGRVRTLAAIIVQRRNDTAAVDMLLAQVGREPVQAARLAQIRALGSLRDARGLTVLLGLLTDPSPSIRSAAARSAAELANAAGPSAVAQASAAIRQAYAAVDASGQSGQRQRYELILALSELNDRSLAGFYRDLLTGPTRPSVDVRAAALRGVARLKSETLSDTVVVFLTDPEPKVREEAVRALAASSLGFERARDLQELLNPRRESNEAVREAAWQAIRSLLPRADTGTLDTWADRFGADNQPERQLEVLRVMAAKQEAAGDREEVAWRHHEMADVHMNALNRPTEAADLYRQALQYSLDNAGTAGLIQTRAQNALQAYLRAKRFDEAISFAREMIERDPSFEQQVGTIVKREAQALTDQGQADAARTLITIVLRQDPPLLARDRLSRQQLQEQLDALPASDNGSPQPSDGTPGPSYGSRL